LTTPWIKDVSPDNAHLVYPCPQMVHERWLNLNGLWELAVTGKEQSEPKEFTEPFLHDTHYYFLAIYVESNILVYDGLLL